MSMEALALAAAVRFLFRWNTAGDREQPLLGVRIPRWLIPALVVAIACLSIGILYLVVFITVSVLRIDWLIIQAFLGTRYGQALGTCIVVVAGGALYLFRRWHRNLYGMLEIGVAVVGCWVALGVFADQDQLQKQGAITTFVAVAAAGYVVVRGLDNLMEGIKEKARDDSSDVPAA